MKKEVYIEIKGGLGNQMFQYALYILLDYLGYRVYLDTYKIIKNSNEHNGLELDKDFDISFRKVSIVGRVKYQLWRVHDKVLRTFFLDTKKKNVLVDREPSSLDEITNSHIHYLKGYWQEPIYWWHIKEDIVKKFTFKDGDIGQENEELLKSIEEIQSVAIHVRRGDYLLKGNQERMMGICTIDYYKKAVGYIKKAVSNAMFYVFTDDYDWVSNNFNFFSYKIIDWNNGSSSYLDMYLMSRCKHNIIANSTFSWWGAFLNQNPDKIVVCPKKWYNNKYSSLPLDEWVRL